MTLLEDRLIPSEFQLDIVRRGKETALGGKRLVLQPIEFEISKRNPFKAFGTLDRVSITDRDVLTGPKGIVERLLGELVDETSVHVPKLSACRLMI